MVTHGNPLHNLRCSAGLARHDLASIAVSWLPVNHDMGLIEGVLQPAYSGFPAYLMSPAAFLQRPVRRLRDPPAARHTAVRRTSPTSCASAASARTIVARWI